MRRVSKRNLGALALGLAIGLPITFLGIAACSGKTLEPFNDAPVGVQNTTPADVLNFPDGFSNVSTKCDHGNRVYVIFHSNSPYGSVAVVANDPTCTGK